MSVVDPIRDARGWAFRDGDGHGPDPVCGFEFLSEAYLRTDPAFTGRYTVPCIWDRVTGRLVTNNYPDITIDFETQFTAYHRRGAPSLYPEPLRDDIDAVNEVIYSRHQQRRLPGGVRDVAAGLRRRRRPRCSSGWIGSRRGWRRSVTSSAPN